MSAAQLFQQLKRAGAAAHSAPAPQPQSKSVWIGGADPIAQKQQQQERQQEQQLQPPPQQFPPGFGFLNDPSPPPMQQQQQFPPGFGFLADGFSDKYQSAPNPHMQFLQQQQQHQSFGQPQGGGASGYGQPPAPPPPPPEMLDISALEGDIGGGDAFNQGPSGPGMGLGPGFGQGLGPAPAHPASQAHFASLFGGVPPQQQKAAAPGGFQGPPQPGPGPGAAAPQATAEELAHFQSLFGPR